MEGLQSGDKQSLFNSIGDRESLQNFEWGREVKPISCPTGELKEKIMN